MNRREWTVAWRFARRLSARRRPLTELQVHAEARHELGRPLPLRSQGYALGALWDRRYTYDELVRLAAKRREHELCKYTRDQVLA